MAKRIRLGQTILADFSGCEYIPASLAEMKKIIHDACVASGATVRIHDAIGDEFTPQGVTAMAILGESHAVIDTWPEYGILTFDIFTCGERADPRRAANYLRGIFRPRHVNQQAIERFGIVE